MNKIFAKKNLVFIITGIAIATIFLVVGIIATVNYIKNDSGFNYLKSNLSKYVEFKEDYKNFELNIDIAEPRPIDVEITILNMLREDKPKTAYVTGSQGSYTIKPGDVVYIWYRGYLVGPDGTEKIEVDGMSNFGDTTPYALEIGSNYFVPGFELSLVGKKTSDYVKFEKITTGKVSEGAIAYVSYERSIANGTNSPIKSTGSAVRIDLADENIDKKYGEGFLEKLKSLYVADDAIEFKTQIDGKEATYTKFKVDFVTNCEQAENVLKAECYFPYDYTNNTDLRNENAVFEVYVAYMDCYYETMPEFNDEYLTKKIEDKVISITLDDLNKFEGETLVDKYRAYSMDLMMKIYEAEKNSMIEQAIWERYSSIANIKKYPTGKVDDCYYEYANQILTLYKTSGGVLQNSYGYTETYKTLNEYANAYMGITSSSEYYYFGETAWQYQLYDIAKNYVKERIVLYYILRDQNLLSDKTVVADEIAAAKQEYLDEYIDQYIDKKPESEKDYLGENRDQFIKAREKELYSIYDEEHFAERAYYAIAAKAMVTWPKVNILDENRRAYPQNQ